jgi:cytochrome P450
VEGIEHRCSRRSTARLTSRPATRPDDSTAAETTEPATTELATTELLATDPPDTTSPDTTAAAVSGLQYADGVVSVRLDDFHGGPDVVLAVTLGTGATFNTPTGLPDYLIVSGSLDDVALSLDMSPTFGDSLEEILPDAPDGLVRDDRLLSGDLSGAVQQLAGASGEATLHGAAVRGDWKVRCTVFLTRALLASGELTIDQVAAARGTACSPSARLIGPTCAMAGHHYAPHDPCRCCPRFRPLRSRVLDLAVGEGAFRTLRQQQPISWWEEFDFPDAQFPRGPGYWSVVNHEDVWHISRNPQLFASGRGVNIGDMPIEIAEFFGSMISMDDPRHFRLRSIVSKGFTPKEIARVEEYVKVKAAGVVDRLLHDFPDRECDFVHEVAAPMPLQIICEMMGIPPDDEEQVFRWTNIILGVGDPEFTTTFEDLFAAGMGMFQYAQALGEDRLATPRDDLTSIMMHAEVDGERLSAQEFGSFFFVLVVAGYDTSGKAFSHGMHLLTTHPDQRALWFDDFEANTRTAVDEIVRYATPVVHFRRTATEDTEVGGQKICSRSWDVVQLGQPCTRCSPTRTSSTCCGRCSRHRWARVRWPALLPGANLAAAITVMLTRSAAASPPCTPSASPTTCRATSSTASSDCAAPGSPASSPRPGNDSVRACGRRGAGARRR